MSVSTKAEKSIRLAWAGARIALVMGLGVFATSGPASSQTVTPNADNPVQHFLDCFGALVSDPTAHAASCDPGHTVFVSGSSGSGSPRCFSVKEDDDELLCRIPLPDDDDDGGL